MFLSIFQYKIYPSSVLQKDPISLISLFVCFLWWFLFVLFVFLHRTEGNTPNKSKEKAYSINGSYFKQKCKKNINRSSTRTSYLWTRRHLGDNILPGIFLRNCYSAHYYNQPKSFYVTSLRLALFRERIRIPQDSQGNVDI